MIEVEVENFQSIEKTQLKIDGFTALVGRSNIGKSALVRAMRSALTGASGTDFVRHGALCERRLKDTKRCKCRAVVRIATPKFELIWEKGDTVNRYTLTYPGGEPILYDKVDRGTPDFLQPDFAPVKIGDTQELIQISEQFSPIFLLDVSGSVVADVLSDVARLDDINGATKLVSSDRKEASSTRVVREQDVADIATTLASYIGLEENVQEVRRIEAQYSLLQTKQQQFEDIERFLKELEVLVKVVRGLMAATAMELPDSVLLQKAEAQLLDILKFISKWDNHEATVERLQGVTTVALPQLTSLEDTANKFDQVQGWCVKIQRIKLDFDKVKTLNATGDLEPLFLSMFSRLKLVTELDARAETLFDVISRLEANEVASEKEATAALKALEELGLCPTCTQPIGSGHELHLEVP